MISNPSFPLVSLSSIISISVTCLWSAIFVCLSSTVFVSCLCSSVYVHCLLSTSHSLPFVSLSLCLFFLFLPSSVQYLLQNNLSKVNDMRTSAPLYRSARAPPARRPVRLRLRLAWPEAGPQVGGAKPQCASTSRPIRGEAAPSLCQPLSRALTTLTLSVNDICLYFSFFVHRPY